MEKKIQQNLERIRDRQFEDEIKDPEELKHFRQDTAHPRARFVIGCVLVWFGSFTHIFQGYFNDNGKAYDSLSVSEATLKDG